MAGIKQPTDPHPDNTTAIERGKHDTQHTDGTVTVHRERLTTRQVEALMHELVQARNLMQHLAWEARAPDKPALI